MSVFRVELPELFPFSEQTKRLSAQTMLPPEFLLHRAPRFPLEREARALVHGHCHHKSVLGMQDEVELLRKAGIDARLLDSGCCGMAGSFGFEREKYDVSLRCASGCSRPRCAPRRPTRLRRRPVQALHASAENPA